MSKNLKIVAIVFAAVVLLTAAYFLLFGQSNNASNIPSGSSGSTSTTNVAINNSTSGNSSSTSNPSTNGSSSNNTSNNSSNPSTNYTPGKPFSIPSPNDSQMTIYAPDGTSIPTNNVYKNPAEKIGNSVYFVENKDYYIIFTPQHEYFQIILLNPDIKKAREEAESDFLRTLGITKDQACKLNVDLGVPVTVNSSASTDNYGLSFCPNGKPFPKS